MPRRRCASRRCPRRTGRRRRPDPGSAPAQVSLIRSAPASQACTATGERQVSTLITRSGKAPRTRAMNGTTRRISSATSTTGPTPAFTPPMSTMSAPSSTARCDGLHGGRVLIGGAGVEEGIRGPVDDRHHGGPVGRKARPRSTTPRFRLEMTVIAASLQTPPRRGRAGSRATRTTTGCAGCSGRAAVVAPAGHARGGARSRVRSPGSAAAWHHLSCRQTCSMTSARPCGALVLLGNVASDR